MNLQTVRDTDRLRDLAADFTDWRIGRGGSGLWWAVRRNDLVRAANAETLRAHLREITA